MAVRIVFSSPSSTPQTDCLRGVFFETVAPLRAAFVENRTEVNETDIYAQGTPSTCRRSPNGHPSNTPAKRSAGSNRQGAQANQSKPRLHQAAGAESGYGRVTLLVSPSEPHLESLQLAAPETFQPGYGVGFPLELASRPRSDTGTAHFRYPLRPIPQTANTGGDPLCTHGTQSGPGRNRWRHCFGPFE